LSPVAFILLAACTEPLAPPPITLPDASTLADPPPERPEGARPGRPAVVTIPSPIFVPSGDRETIARALFVHEGKCETLGEVAGSTGSLLELYKRLGPDHPCRPAVERALEKACAKDLFSVARFRETGDWKKSEEVLKTVMKHFGPDQRCYQEAQKMLEEE
jgi:hypothetical protein